MKNASLNVIYCIFFIVIIPVSIYLCTKNTQTQIDNKNDCYISVFNAESHETIQMPLEEYVWRATAKEVPLSFEDEAIKAQAVAVRTYAFRKIGTDIPEHYGADVCTDFGHCAAFLSQDDENLQGTFSRYKTLCEETKGQIITFENEPILAAFHSISSGITENSSDVWSSQLPYLVNINSELDKNVNGYHSSVRFELNQLTEIFPKILDNEIKILSRTSGGNVKSIEVFGKLYSGQEIRSKLNLRSANFTVTKDANSYIFDVIGYGHGVGMSQHGANEYAKAGMDYVNILKKYYPATSISNISQ